MCNYRVVVITSTFNFGTYIFLGETVVYIEPTSGSRYQHENSCAGLIYFASHNNDTSFIVSIFTSIESCSIYGIYLNCTTYQTSASGSYMLISPKLCQCTIELILNATVSITTLFISTNYSLGFY